MKNLNIVKPIYRIIVLTFLIIIGCTQNQKKHQLDDADLEIFVKPLSSTHFQLNWKTTLHDIDSIRIERKVTSDSIWSSIGVVPKGMNGFSSVGVLESTEYDHRLCLYRETDSIDCSGTVSAVSMREEPEINGTIIGKDKDRQGEGSIIQFDNEDLKLYYNRYPGVAGDETRCEIFSKFSNDNGDTWSSDKLEFEAEDENHSLLHPSLLKLNSMDILISYVRMGNLLDADGKHPLPGGAWAKRVVRKSSDNGDTWSKEIQMTEDSVVYEGRNIKYISGSHDRMIQLDNGRLVFPVLAKDSEETPKTLYTMVYTSDDDGQTWKRRNEPFVLRKGIEIRENKGFNEPSVVEYKPGELLMYMRSYLGWFYESRSFDNGDTWSKPKKSIVRASASPPKLFAIPGSKFIGLIYNPYVNPDEMNMGYRRILSSVISDDGGKTWVNYKTLEYGDKSEEETYDYPSVTFTTHNAHLTYAKGHPYVPRYLVYRKLSRDWFLRE